MFCNIEKISNKYVNLVVDLPDYIARRDNLDVLFKDLNSFISNLINKYGGKSTKKFGNSFHCFVVCNVPTNKGEIFAEQINSHYSSIINQ